ncbi:MAG: sodium:solute symporter family protein [Parasporobacterium sp.]|nr:sodium:solute symporter family protein [Parasporobacterium sp.]
MNVYFWGIIIAMIIFMVIGIFLKRKVKNAEEFYVAGRNAPVLLITGSLVASYLSTGAFMGEAGCCYDGGFAPVFTLTALACAGYIFGSVFFGRYLRRSKALTMPEFFGKRFDSPAVRKLSAVTAIITMSVYLLSIIQGLGTLMEVITGVDYRICLVIAMIVFTCISVMSGSRGVLITDTLMAAIFTIALIVGVGFIAGATGGWFDTVINLAADPETQDLLSWSGRMGVIYNDTTSNALYCIIYGISWMSVCMIGPWQASRYQMAKDESTVVKSGYWSALGVFIVTFFIYIGPVFVNRIYPDMAAYESTTHVLIWASMNIMPKLLGIILLTGIFSAGISSATTFQSLIGSMVVNDVVKVFDDKKSEQESIDNKAINIGRIVMIAVAVIVTVIAVINPPAIFIILYFGGSIIAGSWMPVAVASVFSKRITKTGAFAGMLTGFTATFMIKLVSYFAGWDLPVYLEPCLIGIVLNIIAIIIGSACTRVTDAEAREYRNLFVIPESEKDVKKIKGTLRFTKIGCFIGAAAFVIIIVLWAMPYIKGLGM